MSKPLVGSVPHAESQEWQSVIFEADLERRKEEFDARIAAVRQHHETTKHAANAEDLDRLLGPANHPGRPKNFQRKGI